MQYLTVLSEAKEYSSRLEDIIFLKGSEGVSAVVESLREMIESIHDDRVDDLYYLVTLSESAINKTVLDDITNTPILRDPILDFLETKVHVFTMSIISDFYNFMDDGEKVGDFSSEDVVYIKEFVQKHSMDIFDIFGLHHTIYNLMLYVTKYFEDEIITND